MDQFLQLWQESTTIALGLFWMAFWAFALGYLISSMIQVFVTEKQMKDTMGTTGAKSVALGTLFGFISSSCSFAALASTRSLFTKGAGLIPSLAFLLASTNLVVELGIVIAIFLSWQFVVGEYIGGIILILLMWVVVKLTYPQNLIKKAREHAKKEEGSHNNHENAPQWRKLIQTKEGWRQVAQKYVMEWDMVWKDVTIGFTIAGIIAAFVPQSFFQALFPGSGDVDPDFFQVLSHAIIGPVAAFFTFIGSMGNIPLAAVLFSNGVSFAGVIAFIFSDLVVFPVLRIQAQYYGWKAAFYILGVFLLVLVLTAVILHYGFAFFDMLPDHNMVLSVTERDYFGIDYTLFLNLPFILMTLLFLRWKMHKSHSEVDHHHHHNDNKHSANVLVWLSRVALIWLLGGLLLSLFV